MSWTVPAGERAVDRWRVVRVDRFVCDLLDRGPAAGGRPHLVGVDGRSAAGKSTLARTLSEQVERSVVVHTDDVAWHESLFGWGHLLRDGILRPLGEGRAVNFTPPIWTARGRPGKIEVDRGLDLVLVEGVGAAQQAVAGLLDTAIWVQSDFDLAERRGIERDVVTGVNGGHQETVAFWHEWMAEELAFLHRDQPWARADIIVAGTPPFAASRGSVAIAPRPG